ncbi:hypothetical protein [Paraburkholderia rhynchosiae]|uniref:Uncharacterized protein n=1 Tax=Paraburkholderia rhynchosiae TaxID=487049 RepID=A0A2N7WSR2_9BURK|nr:hypothetical protein [Paraburkholderia rhynchosiae]PMS32315.1 hypothetical protein C0Z16_06785 [Paraburkholderia rhynchosiae]CAB3732087.1 hypothetical protein LMG27174_05893 [Paraburkholderia rhynchosiae]
MKIATGGMARTVLMSACVVGMIGAAHAQSGSARAGNGGLSATPSNGNVNGGAGGGTNAGTGAGTAGSTLSPTPGLATPSGSVGSGRTGSAGLGPALNNMRANGTSLNQNPDPRVPNVSGRPPSPR